MTVDERPSILVVEDENIVALDLASGLEKLGYSVAGIAANGEEAVELAETTKPGLVLMDINLRGEMDGVRAAQLIQDNFFIPVVLLTAYSDQATLERARATHPFGYLLKPFEERELEVAIQIAVYRHQMERAVRASEQRLHAMLSSIGDAVIATDSDRCITFLNKSAESLLGWSYDRAQRRLLSDVLGAPVRGEGFRNIVRGGEVIPVEIVDSPVLDSSGATTGYVTVARDITERLRAQQAHERELLERTARAAAERDRQRLRIKSDIGLVLADFAKPFDMTAAVRRLAGLFVPGLADWCVLHIEDREGPIRVAIHSDPEKTAWAEEIQERWPPARDAAVGPYAVMRSGEAELLETISDHLLEQATGDPEQLGLLRKMEMKSYLCVPLRVRQRIFGSLMLISTSENHHYRQMDLSFAQEVADRAAMAVDNALLYREAQEARAKAERLFEDEQEARAEAETLFHIADALGEAQLDLDALVQRVTDEATAVVRAKFGAFFYKVVDEGGEAYMLYALSGAPREAFDELGMPALTGSVVRIDDVRLDPRYEKMASGRLSVASYLAVPVVHRGGDVIGWLIFGHPEPGQFSEQHERVVKALAAHAAVAVDNARLFRATREGEEKQSQLVRELERTVRFSEMLMGILGHDLRNPLSAITTAAVLVLTRGESERIVKPVSRILSSADRMARMIDQILDFTLARIGRGIPLHRKRADLGDVCKLVVDELEGDVEEATDLEIELRGDLAGEWDADRLSQLLSNLAGNAVQHRPRGTPASISIDGTHPDRVRLEIHNQGVIPPEIVPVIFEPFRSGPDHTRAHSRGLGLGLFISKQIAIAHGGTIRVETGGAQGTRFIVELPRVPPAATDQVFTGATADDSHPRE